MGIGFNLILDSHQLKYVFGLFIFIEYYILIAFGYYFEDPPESILKKDQLTHLDLQNSSKNK